MDNMENPHELQCEFCGKEFKSKRGLTAHHNREIKCNQPLNCPKCGQRFERKYNLDRHLKRANPCVNPNPHNICPKCKKEYSSPGYLKRHLAKCTGPKPNHRTVEKIPRAQYEREKAEAALERNNRNRTAQSQKSQLQKSQLQRSQTQRSQLQKSQPQRVQNRHHPSSNRTTARAGEIVQNGNITTSNGQPLTTEQMSMIQDAITRELGTNALPGTEMPPGFRRIIDDEYPEQPRGEYPRVERWVRNEHDEIIRTETAPGQINNNRNRNIQVAPYESEDFMRKFNEVKDDPVAMTVFLDEFEAGQAARAEEHERKLARALYDIISKLPKMQKGYYNYGEEIWDVHPIDLYRSFLENDLLDVTFRILNMVHLNRSHTAYRNIRCRNTESPIELRHEGRWMKFVCDESDVKFLLDYKNRIRKFYMCNREDLEKSAAGFCKELDDPNETPEHRATRRANIAKNLKTVCEDPDEYFKIYVAELEMFKKLLVYNYLSEEDEKEYLRQFYARYAGSPMIDSNEIAEMADYLGLRLITPDDLDSTSATSPKKIEAGTISNSDST